MLTASARLADRSAEPRTGLRRPRLLLPLAFLVAPLAQAATIAAGTDHSIAIKDDGTVWVWGDNSHGQLGNGTSGTGTGSLVPVQVPGLANIIAVSAGQDFSIALEDSGQVWTWGDDVVGQLGDGAAGAGRTTPYQITSLTGITMIAAGQQFVLALRSDGSVWAWGKNSTGQLGDNTTSQRASPIQVKNTAGTGFLGGITAVAAGGFHSLAVSTTGAAFAWGKNANGQVGINNVTTPQKLPKQVLGVGASGTLANVSSVAAALNSSFALLTDGTVVSWGINTNGVLGDATTSQRTAPVQVKGVGGAGILTNVKAIAAGDLHALAAKNDGTLWAWGKGSAGQRGNNTTGTTQSSPVQVKDTAGTGFLTNVVASEGGVSFSLAVTTTNGGTAWGWGLNTLGQVGDNSTTQRNTPRQVGTGFAAGEVAAPAFSPPANTYNTEQNVGITSATPGATIRYTTNGDPVDLGSAVLLPGQTVAVTSSMTLKAKAWAGTGASSAETQAVYVLKVATPVVLPSSSGPYTEPIAVSISTTSGASIYYTTDGSEPTTASTPYSGAFSVGTSTTVKAKGFRAGWTESDTAVQSYTFNFQALAAPVIAPPSGNYISSASVSMSSISGATIRFTMDGSEPDLTSSPYVSPLTVDIGMTVKARAWHPDWLPSPSSERSYTIQAAKPIVTPDGGSFTNPQAVVITTATPDASVRYTTSGADPGLGDPAVGSGPLLVDRSLTLKARAFKAGVTPSDVETSDFTINRPMASAGRDHSFLVKPDGTVWVWGQNGDGRFGNGSTSSSSQPVLIPGLTSVKAVAAGVAHSLFLKADGTVWAAGSNFEGQLGNGQSGGAAPNQPTPIQVRQSATIYLTNVVALAAGDYFNLALKADGSVWAWGRNSNGQVGNGTQTLAPYAVQAKSGCQAIGAGGAFSLAVDAQGRVWGWGHNAFGQLGDATSVDRPSPVAVVGLTNVVSVAGGESFSLALRDDGAVWAWGENGVHYRLGDGTSTNRSTPARVLGLTGVIAISTNWRHSMALKSDGTVWTWGSNDNTALGYLTPSPQTVPKAVPGLSGAVSIAASGKHSLAITSDHGVWGWGRNWNGFLGQLGDGSGRSTRAPTPLMDPGLVPKSATPTVYVEGGFWGPGGAPTSVTLSGLAGTEVHYTTNGVDPTLSDATASTSGTVIALNGTTTIKARSWSSEPGRNPSNVALELYDVKLSTPSFNPGATQHSSAVNVVISSNGAPSGTELWYTTNGSAPVKNGPGSTLYAAPINISQATTLRAKAFKAGLTDSDEGSGSYTFNYGTVAAPAVTPPAGTYAGAQSNVQLGTTTSGATIRYAVDGSDPTTSSPVYAGPFSIANSLTLKARAWKTDWTPSPILVADFTITYASTVATPTISLASSTQAAPYTTPQTATLSCATASSTIRYTTDSTLPTWASTAYLGQPLTIDRGMTLLARCFRSGWTDSGLASATYVFRLPAPLASPGGGSAPQTVTVTQATLGSSIHYTLDGTEPALQDDAIATGATLLIDATRTLKLKAWKDGWIASPTATHQYLMGASTVETPRFWPGAGSYATAQSVVIWSTTPRAVVRYTTDGSDPTHRSPVARGKILVAESGTIKAKAFKAGFSASPTAAAAFTVTLANTVAAPSLSLPSGAYATRKMTLAACATAGAVVRYTLNGQDPTDLDPVAPAGGIAVDESGVVRVRGFKAGMTPSPVRSVSYRITGMAAAGGQVSMAVKGSAELFAWGNGPLGRGVTEQQPTPVSIAPYLQNVVAASVSWVQAPHVLALDANGQVWAWGANTSGQVTGVAGSTVQTPTAVAGVSGVIAIAAGGAHSLALKADGTVWGWGLWYAGNGSSAVPGQVRTGPSTPLQSVVAIAAGNEHSVALRADGSVWSWGRNFEGELGIGTTSQASYAVQAIGLSGVAAVGASQFSTFALKTDGAHEGTLHAWGASYEGSLGNGIHELNQGFPLVYNQLTPAPVGALPALGAVSHGNTLMAALEADRLGGYLLWAWGNNTGGGVGDGTQSHRYVPVRSAFQSAVGITAGYQHMLARSHDGTLWAWGQGSSGQLGNGSTGLSTAPVQVQGLTLASSNWPGDDSDLDGLSNSREWELGTDPLDPDSDGDAIPDGSAANAGLDPTEFDQDHDGVINAVERASGTDPFAADTDGDGVADGADAFPLDPTRSSAAPGTPGDVTPPVITLAEPTGAQLISSTP